jgi:hypothetical protein
MSRQSGFLIAAHSFVSFLYRPKRQCNSLSTINFTQPSAMKENHTLKKKNAIQFLCPIYKSNIVDVWNFWRLRLCEPFPIPHEYFKIIDISYFKFHRHEETHLWNKYYISLQDKSLKDIQKKSLLQNVEHDRYIISPYYL